MTHDVSLQRSAANHVTNNTTLGIAMVTESFGGIAAESVESVCPANPAVTEIVS